MSMWSPCSMQEVVVSNSNSTQLWLPLAKQSGGKSEKRGSVGNIVAKWDRRWFCLGQEQEAASELRYFRNATDLKPAGVLNCAGELELWWSSIDIVVELER